jgi:spermidine synthase
MVKIEILQYKEYKVMFINDKLWMWDAPEEREMQKSLSKEAYGDVLVAGYGFGILTEMLTKNPKVKSVTTVERYGEVIEKMKKFGKIHGNVVISDFFSFQENRKFDCIIGDIWPDIDARFLKDYVKFKNKTSKLLKKNGKILAWGKDYFEYLLKKRSAR